MPLPEPASSIDLTGLIDMHLHAAPDVRPRALDDIQLARQAAAAGMRAVLIKSHVTLTADRAAIAQSVVPNIRVFGGLALNEQVGGLNPAAVEAALQLGARAIWMPTRSAENHVAFHGGSGGIQILLPDGTLHPSVGNILQLVAEQEAILATGHISVRESVALVRAARAAGVHKVVVTHPEVPWVDMPPSVQEKLRDGGAWFERCFVSTTALGGGVDMARIVEDIRRVGVDSTVLATDLGQVGNPLPVDGFRQYIAALLAAGWSQRDVERMAGRNPAHLLGL